MLFFLLALIAFALFLADPIGVLGFVVGLLSLLFTLACGAAILGGAALLLAWALL